MNVLIACEESATVREAFAKKGHNAWSCDLLPSRIPGNRLQCDVLTVLEEGRWDLMIAHPPCDYLTVSGNAWFSDDAVASQGVLVGAARRQAREDAAKATCLWIRGLPKLVATNILIKDRYANQTPSGQNKLGPSAERKRERSKTYQGIADAMAEQWGQ